MAVSQTATAPSPAYDFAAEAAIDACASPVATHQAAQSASERESSTRVYASASGCETAIQALGGIGFTWEHRLHRLYKRALGIESFGASGTRLRAKIAASLIDASDPGSGVSQTPDQTSVPVPQGG